MAAGYQTARLQDYKLPKLQYYWITGNQIARMQECKDYIDCMNTGLQGLHRLHAACLEAYASQPGGPQGAGGYIPMLLNLFRQQNVISIKFIFFVLCRYFTTIMIVPWFRVV